jgi:predicted Zn-dependent protease with MMP-like domain
MDSSVTVLRRLASCFAVTAAAAAGIASIAGAAFLLVGGVGPLWIRLPVILAGAATAVVMTVPLRREKLGEYLASESAEDGDNDAEEQAAERLSDSFETLVAAAVAELPVGICARMSNVALVVEDEPPEGEPFLGFYYGVPLSSPGRGYTGVAPDKITLYRGPLERFYGSDTQGLSDEIARVVRHEIAHHLGISDELLDRDRPVLTVSLRHVTVEGHSRTLAHPSLTTPVSG